MASAERICSASSSTRAAFWSRFIVPPAPGFCGGAVSAPNPLPEVWGREFWSLSLRGHRLFDDVARARGVDLDPGPHRGGDRDRVEIAALGHRGLGPDQLVDHCGVVLQQRPRLE